jgi:hypothetical protein
MSARVLDELRANDSGHAVTDLLNSPTTFVTVTGPTNIPPDWKVTPTQSFTSSADLIEAVNGNKLIAGVHTLLLDIERWKLTPIGEQNRPVDAYAKAYSVAHAHNLRLIATPAIDLGDPTAKKLHKAPWQAYLDDLKLPERISAHADVFEVQSQSQEEHPDRFADMLAKAKAQVDQANSKAVFFGGVSTNPDGRTVTAEQMVDAVRATQGTVTRYWLNDPEHSTACESCNGPHAAEALRFLAVTESRTL